MDLDWALANMEAKTKRPAGKKNSWVWEAEKKAKKEDVRKIVQGFRLLSAHLRYQGELRGLGALLFDDDTPPVPAATNGDHDEISKTLKDIGVTYTHRNESLVAENPIEGERMKVLVEVRKLRILMGSISDTEPIVEKEGSEAGKDCQAGKGEG